MKNMDGAKDPPVEDIVTAREDAQAEKDDALYASSKAVLLALNPEGKSKLHLEEVLDRIKTTEKGDGEKKNTQQGKHVANVVKKLLRDKAGEGLNENDMKRLNKRFMDGHLPRLKHGKRHKEEEDGESDEEGEQKRPEGIKKKVLRHAVSSVRSVSRYAEKFVSRTGRTWMWKLVPTGQISTLLSFLLFSYVIKASFLSWFVPLAVLTIAIFIMVISSIRIVRGMKRFAEFRAWADFLDAISVMEKKAIDTGKAEENYLLNHISPYIHFLIATACCVMGYGTSDKSWVLKAELGILALIMYGTVVYVFGFHQYGGPRSVFAFQIMSSVLRGFRCGDTSFGFGYLTSVELPFLNIAVNFSLPSVLRALMMYQVASMFWKFPRNAKIGAHLVKYVLPLVVAVIWWDIADMFFCHSSVTGILRASVEYVSLLFAMPVFVMFVAYSLLKFIFSIEVTKASVTIIAIAAATAYLAIWKKKDYIAGRLKTLIESSSLKNTIYVIGFIALGYMMLSYRPSGIKVPKSGLSWAHYSQACLHNEKLDSVGNNVALFALCNEFKGYGVTWEGMVEKVDISSIQNKAEDLLNLLPHDAATWLSCVYGSHYPTPEECSKTEDLKSLDKALCSISQIVQRPCHIQKHNIYTFKITVAMPGEDDPQFVTLDVSNDFYDLVENLKKGTALHFSGTIVGNGRISAKVLSASSDNDQIKLVEKRRKRIEKTFDNMLDDAVVALHKFVLFPIISLKEDDTVED